MTEMETKPMARIGDTHVCPLHGTNTIVTGSTGFFIFDRPVARVGDRTECGAIILTGAPDAYDGDRLIAYEGSTTSHGGTITTGSPDAFVSVPKVLPYEIYDPPLERVPILPIEATAQAVVETIKTIREEGLTPGVVAGAVVGAITRKVWSPGPRPKGVPKDWISKPSDKDGGTKWVDPNNRHNWVRPMPGNPNSPYPNSRKPYIRWNRNGRPLDRSGRELPTDHSSEAHIPLNDFEYIP